jgi:hypothetical protein
MNDDIEMQSAPIDEGQFSQQPDEGQQAQPPQTPAAVSLTPDTIAALVKTMQAAPVTQPQPQQPQLSQAEINKMLAVFNADRRHIERLGLKYEDPNANEDAVAALNEILDGKTRQAVTMSSLVVENLKRQIQQELAPLRSFVAAERERQLRDEFFKANDDLKDFTPLVEAVYTQLQNNNVNFSSKEEAFKTVAEQARQLLAKLQPGQGGSVGTATTTPRRMPTVTTGGRGGAGMSGGGKQIDPIAKAMFG